jgi:hypothetical protein
MKFQSDDYPYDYISAIWLINAADVEWLFTLTRKETDWVVVARSKEHDPNRGGYFDSRSKREVTVFTTSQTDESVLRREMDGIVRNLADHIEGQVIFVPIEGDAELAAKKLSEHPDVVTRVTVMTAPADPVSPSTSPAAAPAAPPTPPPSAPVSTQGTDGCPDVRPEAPTSPALTPTSGNPVDDLQSDGNFLLEKHNLKMIVTAGIDPADNCVVTQMSHRCHNPRRLAACGVAVSSYIKDTVRAECLRNGISGAEFEASWKLAMSMSDQEFTQSKN